MMDPAPPLEIPLFPLRSVLFPAGFLPLRIFEPRYLAMTDACLRDQSVFGVCLIRAGFETGQPAVPHAVGCTARIREWEQPQPERYTLMATGENRFTIQDSWTRDDGLLMAKVRLLEPPDPLPVPDAHHHLAELLERAITQIGDAQFPSPQRLDDAAWVANRLTELLPVTPERKQQILECEDPARALAKVEQMLAELREDPPI
ncbi:LON peptidase substrate-binding domain-containing protein [Algiphilus sp.]|uniref:LON peptidase substrate-binding domain-containing protein n=1 Tax=Algiphilus sp. TaxID=1872431 RepID=UPI0032EF3D47